MPDVKAIFDEISSLFDGLFKILPKYENTYSGVDQKEVKRLHGVLMTLQSKFEDADVDNTSINVYKRILGILRGAFSTINDGKAPSSVFEEAADNLLEQIPLIAVTRQSVSEFSDEANQKLDSVKDIERDIEAIKIQVIGDLEEIQNLKLQNERLVQMRAGKVLNNFFEERAIDEKTSADKWTKATWFFAILTVLAIILTFIWQVYSATENTINYQLLSTKILFTVTLGLIAKWTSKRANRHLMEESKYHRLAVNMATINSFIAPLEQEEKNKVISEIAVKTFTDGTPNEVSTDYETANILDFIKTVLPKGDK